jgi:hypothetical protein
MGSESAGKQQRQLRVPKLVAANLRSDIMPIGVIAFLR